MAEQRRRKREVSADEERLWRLVVRDAAPLSRAARARVTREQTAREIQPGPLSAPSATAPPPARPEQLRIGGALDRPTVTVRHALPGLEPGASPGVDKRTAQRFNRGKMTIDARIDLHGMTQEAAHRALTGFIESSVAAGRRCVLVITGKGTRGEGVIRRAVPKWLNDERLRPCILSYNRAQPQHGGEGALYVLLRRKRS